MGCLRSLNSHIGAIQIDIEQADMRILVGKGWARLTVGMLLPSPFCRS